MGAQVIDGKGFAAKLRERVGAQAEKFAQAAGRKAGLAVVLVGEDPASQVYVRSKHKATVAANMESFEHRLPADTGEAELLALVERLNADPAVDGILVQLPLPGHLDEQAVIAAISPDKDVDGFHPVNVGKLVMEDESGFVPCTPCGCVRLIRESGIETSGANAVVIGRSMIVGKPMALLLMAKGVNATVTVAHSRTRNLAEVCRQADILVAAVGRPEFVTADFVKEGAVVIDVGINRVEDASRKRGYRLVGDVAYDEVAPKCRAITPVPGGVGPMTIALLMSNTVKAARLRSEAG